MYFLSLTLRPMQVDGYLLIILYFVGQCRCGRPGCLARRQLFSILSSN